MQEALWRGDDQGTPRQLLTAESTKEALRSPHAEFVFFDELPIRGRVEPVKPWSVAEVWRP